MHPRHGEPDDWPCNNFWARWTMQRVLDGDAPESPEDDPHQFCSGAAQYALWDPSAGEPERSAPKPRTTATFWVTATVTPSPNATYERDDHAQVVLDYLWETYRPDREKTFVVSAGTADGDTLKLVVSYTARGANADDVRRRIVRSAGRLGRYVEEKADVVRR